MENVPPVNQTTFPDSAAAPTPDKSGSITVTLPVNLWDRLIWIATHLPIGYTPLTPEQLAAIKKAEEAELVPRTRKVWTPKGVQAILADAMAKHRHDPWAGFAFIAEKLNEATDSPAPTPIKIAVTNRTDDVHACIDGHPGIWGCGKTMLYAIGNLVAAHSERFNVEIVWPKSSNQAVSE